MTTDKKSYLHHLPPVLWQENGTPPDFLERLLKIFQEINDELEAEVDDIRKLFDPWKTKSDHLPWLASWVALDLDKDWTEPQKRTLIRHIVSLYTQRGTKEGLKKYLKIYVGSNVEIDELPPDTSAHTFKVTITYPQHDEATTKPSGRVLMARKVRAILDREKPAHTHYVLVIKYSTMQIGVHSTIGKDSILGTTR